MSQCVLTYTLTDSECARSILDTNLESAGWEKTEFQQQTHWMAEKPTSEFMTRQSGKLQFDDSKINEKFRGYFAGVKEDCKVDASFVLVVGNTGKCAVKFTKSKNTTRYRIEINELD